MGTFDSLDDAISDAGDAAAGPIDGFLKHLAERVGGRAGVTTVYGEPVTANGVTIVPVARSRWGFGGGAGEGGAPGNDGAGAGGGGGAMSSPVGYIEIVDARAAFVPIPDPTRYWPLILAGGFATWLVLRGMKALLR